MIFAEKQTGAPQSGLQAVDVKWTNYGAYLQRMIEMVQIRWDALISEAKKYPKPGCKVAVKFKMNSEGAISRIVSVDGSGAGPVAERYCVSAITQPSPYGKWTDDMVAKLGTEQEMTFVFYYQ